MSNLLTHDLVLSEHCKAFLWLPYVTAVANRSTKQSEFILQYPDANGHYNFCGGKMFPGFSPFTAVKIIRPAVVWSTLVTETSISLP